MADEKLRELIERLLAKTVAGEIRWSETPSEEAFQVYFPSSSVEIDRAGSFVHLRVYNSQGKILDEVSDETISPGNVWASDKTKKINELYSQAKRQALAIDQALEDLLSALG